MLRRGKPWATFNRGNAISPRQVAKRLKEYSILSHTIRIGIETAKGYTAHQFREVFSRYLPDPAELSVTTSQACIHVPFTVTDNPSRYPDDMQNVTREPAANEGCDAVTDKNPETEAFTMMKVESSEVPP
ncbi:MAG: DUF3631 domain-containing protein [Desulfuromonadaceae bacterium]